MYRVGTYLAALLIIALYVSATPALADTNNYSGATTAAGSVTVRASITTKLVLEIATPGSDTGVVFGAIMPGTQTATQTVGLVVRSNRAFSVSKTTTGAAELGLITTLPGSIDNPKTDAATFTDDYAAVPPMTTDPGTYSAQVEYTVVQE